MQRMKLAFEWNLPEMSGLVSSEWVSLRQT